MKINEMEQNHETNRSFQIKIEIDMKKLVELLV